ncbi:MAG: cysteine desulfurase [Bacilli bacterium]|nr:cysteine desulfurase [Bacilli bacterium]
MNREDFPILSNDLIYFDNGATTLKPISVIESNIEYYTKYSANAHRGDYDISQKVDSLYEETRDLVRDFINANDRKEIVFTSGATESLNMIVFGFMKNYLHKGDEVLITKSEHASNVLPWYKLKDEIGINIKFIELENNMVTLDNVKKAITSNTKVISLAEITNTFGDTRNMEAICEMVHPMGILVVCDGCQSVPHKKTNVIESGVDFLAFSAHKMLGPTGIGVLYGKYELLNQMEPIILGGGMNSVFECDLTYENKELPSRLEAGTQNIAGILGLRKAIKYLNNLGMDNIHQYELELREYFINKLREVNDVIIYNKDILSNTILFNIKDIFSQDTSRYLNHYHICVRAGNHCAKMVKDLIGIANTCRVSLYFYNTKEEVDKFIEVIKNHDDLMKVIIDG